MATLRLEEVERATLRLEENSNTQEGVEHLFCDGEHFEFSIGYDFRLQPRS
jgi:hypothetical protein